MALDWKTYTEAEWGTFTEAEWGSFLEDPHASEDYYVAASGVFIPQPVNSYFDTRRAQATFAAGAKKQHSDGR